MSVIPHILQLYPNKLDKPEEIDKFWETYTLPKLNQKEIDNMNRTTTTSEVEILTKKNLHQTKIQDQTTSQGNSIKHKKKS